MTLCLEGAHCIENLTRKVEKQSCGGIQSCRRMCSFLKMPGAGSSVMCDPIHNTGIVHRNDMSFYFHFKGVHIPNVFVYRTKGNVLM